MYDFLVYLMNSPKSINVWLAAAIASALAIVDHEEVVTSSAEDVDVTGDDEIPIHDTEDSYIGTGWEEEDEQNESIIDVFLRMALVIFLNLYLIFYKQNWMSPWSLVEAVKNESSETTEPLREIVID